MTKKNQVPRSIKRAYPNVKSIIDAKRGINIHVKSVDCEKGEALNASECALAKAVKREFHADAAIIGLGASYIIKETKATRFHTPERIRREIVSFDRHKDFAEGIYNLACTPLSHRLGVKRNSKIDKRKRSGKHVARIHIKSARVRVFSTE